MMSLIREGSVAIGSSMGLLLIAQVTVVFGLGLAATRLAGRARASVRHLLLVSTFLAAAALPAASLLMPRVSIDVPVEADSRRPGALLTELSMPASMNAVRSIAAAPTVIGGTGWSIPGWLELVGILWAAGTAFALASLIAALSRLALIRRAAIPCLSLAETTRALAGAAGLRRGVAVVSHEAIRIPIICGVLRPTIVLPPDACSWSGPEIRRTLVHELEHVRRGDWAVQLVVRVIGAMYWFHPLARVACRQLSLEAERACDDVVIATGEGTDYAEQLVQLASRLSHAPGLPTLGMANRSDLSARVSALLDPGQRRGRAGAGTVPTTAVVAVLVVATIAPLRAVAVPLEGGSTTVSEQSFSQGRVSSADRGLFRAAGRGDLERIVQLLDAGANINCAIDGDGSPLIAAARAGRLDAVALLLDRGADPNLAVRGDGNPLIMAAREGHGDVVAMLLDRGAAIEGVVPSDENALIQASGKGRLAVVKLLVSRGADVNARVWADTWTGGVSGGEWRTPLGMARRGGHGDVAAFLISAGARQ